MALIAAGCCLLVFFLLCRSRILLLKKAKSKPLAAWIGAPFGLLVLLLFAESALAAPCDIKPGTPPIIRHDLTSSYCELCSYGYVTIVISNPYEGADITGMTVVENLLASGLTYDSTAPNPVTYRVNGGPLQVGGAPGLSGANNSILTWTSAQIPALGGLAYDPDPFDVSTITITFAVTRVGGVVLPDEGLITATRDIVAQVTYTAEYLVIPPPPAVPTYIQCPGMPTTVTSGVDTLQLREPNPEVFKRGRNVDADQDSWSQTVYGNVNDDVIWRIRVLNSGQADLQDLRFDDLMETGNVQINYACPTASAAAAIAANNGIDPGGGGCIPAGNTTNNFDVDNPFGNPGNDSPDLVDVQQDNNAYIYLVGKIPATPNGSCETNKINTVSDIQWGCEVDSPAGGITTTSTGITPGNATATLSTLSVNSGNNLDIQTEIIGTNTSQPAGSKGTVRITIRNNSGGTVKDIKLRNILPVEYVVDSTFTPTVTATGAYGAYAGMTDRIEWTNPVPGTFPLTTTDPAVALSNTAPEFRLFSSTTHPIYADQFDMLRHGDRLVITFRIVLIRPQSYDKVANLDVRIEAPNSDPPGTDPDNSIQLTNQLYVDFENFCQPGFTRHPPTNPLVTTHQSNPEDLDINIAGSELVFILTDDPAQRLPLTVNLRNNGGHEAADYFAYVTFGTTMNVVTVPASCTLTSNPPQHEEWRIPAPIPPGATVYQCTGSPIGPGQTNGLTFEVVKSTGPADLAADDLTFRADTVGEITLSDGTPLWFPTPVNPRTDGGTDDANNYSLDGIRARVIGFNLLKSQVGTCSENNPPPTSPDREVQIGEECTYHIDTGGWFGFQTPGFTIIAVQDIQVVDQLPDGQGYISSTDPYLTSTSAIQGISLNPAGLAPLDEVAAPDWMNWTFNQIVPAERIMEKDHWFRVDMTSRLLNDPIDTSAAPNQHAADSTNILNSYFQAVFFNDITGLEEIYDLGPSTVGYPRAEVRRIELTDTEPNIIVVKEVCNESLYGTGPTCSNFVSLADDGDAYNAYIYRLTLTNETSSSGVDRAPAYDVTVTDRLDASDLAYVLPFASDGLDNDGDGSMGGADTDGEGAISDNTVNNSLPAVLTFSHTHSSALLRIDAGQSVQLYYRVDFDDNAAPLQTFTNSADATYDSLEGVSGNQSAPQRPNSDKGGARVYTSPPDSAAVQIIPVETQPKRITDLSNTPLAPGPVTQAVSIGEEIEYRLNTLLPVALLRNFVIRDELPAGLRCSEAPAVNLNAPPYTDAGFVPGGIITPTCTDNLVEWNFGDQRVTNGTVGDRYDFEIRFIARVENTAGTNDGNVIFNGDPATVATASYIDEVGNLVMFNFEQVDVLVSEPRIELTKAFAVTDADAGDILTVTVTATNTGTAAAYNLRVLDNLDGLNLTFIGNVGGSNPPDNVDTTTQGANQPIFSWNPPNGIDAGDSISFTFEIQVDDVVQPQEILDNTIQADWASLPGQNTALNSTGMIGANGSETGMRNGALPNAGGAINDYETNAANQVTVPALTFTKNDLDPTAIPAIGKRKNFQLDIRLPEGVTNDVIVTDSLDATGLSYILENNAVHDITYTFEGIATINGLAPDESSFNAFPTDGASGIIVWYIGAVVTQTENDTSQNNIDPLIRIQYYARVNNDLVTDSGDTLQNGAVLNYTHGETGAQETLIDAPAAVTVVEPLLAAAKTLSNVTPGKQPADPPEGGDLLEYVIVILNSGTSTAYDVNVVDTLPATLSFYAGFTPTAMIGGTAVAGFVATPANSPNGPLIWGRDNGDGSLDIPVGQSLVLTYRTVVQSAGGDISNSAMVDWTSLDGASNDERDGDGCPNWTAPDDYCTGPAVATTTTVDNNSVDKTVTADTFDTAPWSTAVDSVVRIGDFITYRLALNLSGGLIQNLVAQDTLPGGMVFVETVSINGDTTAAYTPPVSGEGSNFSYAAITAANVPAAGQTGALTWTIDNVVNDPFGDPTTDAIEIIYRARILPDAGIAHVASTTLSNTVSMDYETAAGPATTQTDSATVTVVQPVLAVTKSAVADGGDTVLAADEIVTYTVDIANSGGAPAYDPQLTDIIPVGMRNGTATITTVSMELLSGTVLPNLAPTYNAATGVATWEFDTGVADQYAIPAGDTLRIVYQVQTDTSLSAGMALTNEAQIQRYYSLDDDDIPIQGGIDGEAQIYGPSNVSTVTLTTAAPEALVKDNPDELNVAVGEPFTYRITVPATPQDTALNDVRILDDLSASAADLLFVSVTKVSGSEPWTPVNTGSATNLIIEDPTIGIDIPAGEQIIIDITVVLEDTATNVSGLQFNNTADYTFNQINGDPTTQIPGGSDTTANMTIVGADTVTLEKNGPAIVQLETLATYTLNLHNTSTGTVWNPIITDRIPNEATGGMCGAGPSNVSAQIFLADGVTTASSPLVEGTDFTIEFDGDLICEWRFNLLSPAGGVPSDQRLIVNYDVALNPDTENGITLTNVAGVTRWYSADPDAAGAAPRIFDRIVTDGTPGTMDHEDNHTITTEAPILEFLKTVQNITTGQNPGSNASPGDTLRYIIQIRNSGPVGLASFSIVDEVDRLNATPAFVIGSLNLINVPAGADTSGTDALGGTHGTGLVNIANLSIGAQGEPDDTVVVEFEITLAPVITSGTMVLNQAELIFANPNPLYSDDPNIPGDTDPTETLIVSAPAFEVQKISTIMSGDPNVLMAGETLRYTLTIKNIGNEDAVNVQLRDFTPANTTYVANSTTLNGVAVPDTNPGVNPLNVGILLNAPENVTPGYMRADATPGVNNVATVVFSIVVDPNAMNGLIIENQGFVSGSGAGSGPQPEQPSDDPNTPIPDDPTRNVVGNLPLLYAQKTVLIQQDFGSSGIVDPGDVLRYTIVISNFGAIPATNVVLTDAVPTNTIYVADSLRLNGASLGPDGGVLPLIAGLSVQSDDNPGVGIVSAGESAVITFEARVNVGVPTGTFIINQGSVTSNELPPEPTDADGVPSNGNQPTVIVVGDVQLLTVSKEVLVVGGGASQAGGQLEYVIRVINIGSLPAISVVVTDDLSPPLGNQVSYVAGSGTLNGATTGVTYVGSMLMADYASVYGDLQPGGSAVVRFRVQIDPTLASGTTIINTGIVSWNVPTQSDSASVSIDVGGTPGSAALNGNAWHDDSLDRGNDSTEQRLEGWSVELYRNSQLVTTVLTDVNGIYRFSGLVPNEGTSDLYELRFRAADAGPNTPSLGYADSPFTNGPQRISDITVASGASLQNLNMPLWPNGTIYNSVAREPVAGARVTLLNATTGAALPSQCFDDPVQQNQVTTQNGFYKFDLNFSDASCPAGGAYLIEVTPPTTGYLDTPSMVIPPASDENTAPFSIPACPGSADDAVPATAEYCEVVASAAAPPVSVPPRTAGTIYHLNLLLNDGTVPGQSQVFNNPIPIDPELNGAVAITKTSSVTNVTRGILVPYTITVTNVYGVPLYDISIVDRFPAGFKYVAGSARLDGNPAEPRINGRELIWDDLELQVNQKYTIQLLLTVGSGVSEGEYINWAVVLNTATGGTVSGEATATVRVIPDPDFDCTDVIGKVFDDSNLNGHQDPSEQGLSGVRVVTVRGLIATTDKHGRFHITCAAVPDEDRGSNFILKLDERSLPTGYRLTTENPRVQRATRGKMLRFNFGATVHRVVRIDIADGVFEPDTTELRIQWRPGIARLLEELKKAPSVLRLSYLVDVERKGLVRERLEALKKKITKQWERSDGGYRLVIETEIFWRRGAPLADQ
jgi:uncharacterized repeat protein (TIGR01451 family)/fimbrial isopeptide formation D2 family protein